MTDLSEIFASLSKEDMANLKSVAQSLLTPTEEEKAPIVSASKDVTKSNQDVLALLSKLPKNLKADSESTLFLKSLRPLLSTARQQKVDEAIAFLQLMDTLPRMKGML